MLLALSSARFNFNRFGWCFYLNQVFRCQQASWHFGLLSHNFPFIFRLFAAASKKYPECDAQQFDTAWKSFKRSQHFFRKVFKRVRRLNSHTHTKCIRTMNESYWVLFSLFYNNKNFRLSLVQFLEISHQRICTNETNARAFTYTHTTCNIYVHSATAYIWLNIDCSWMLDNIANSLVFYCYNVVIYCYTIVNRIIWTAS